MRNRVNESSPRVAAWETWETPGLPRCCNTPSPGVARWSPGGSLLRWALSPAAYLTALREQRLKSPRGSSTLWDQAAARQPAKLSADRIVVNSYNRRRVVNGKRNLTLLIIKWCILGFPQCHKRFSYLYSHYKPNKGVEYETYLTSQSIYHPTTIWMPRCTN